MILKEFILFLLAASSLHSMYATTSRVVVITGASQGIGLETTSYLAQKGYTVCAGVRKTSSRSQLEQLVQKFPEHVMIVDLDVTDQAMIDVGCKTILDRFGRIDVLVNNACEIFIGPMETQTIEEQQRVMDVNYFGAVRLIQAIAPIMRKQESGNIINISSIAGFEPFPHLETYVASKYALEGLSESLAVTLAPWNIKVSLIEPGAVRTQVPAHVHSGTHLNDNTQCFNAYNKTILSFMRTLLDATPGSPGFSEALEVAQCIENIITTPNPHVRYQIGDTAKNLALERFKDTTGNGYVQEKKEQFEQLGFVIRETKKD